MKTQGHVFKYPDNVDTDVIIPARYLNTPNAGELARHCMEDIDTDFVKEVQPGDVILLHDFYSTSVDAALEIIDCLQAEGYDFVTVEELFRIQGVEAQAGVLYARPDKVREVS